MKNLTVFSILHCHTHIPPRGFSGSFGPLWGRTASTGPPHSPLTCSSTASWLSLRHWGAPSDIQSPRVSTPSSSLFSSPPKNAQNETNCPGQQHGTLIKPFPCKHPPERGSAGTVKGGQPPEGSELLPSSRVPGWHGGSAPHDAAAAPAQAPLRSCARGRGRSCPIPSLPRRCCRPRGCGSGIQPALTDTSSAAVGARGRDQERQKEGVGAEGTQKEKEEQAAG